MINGLSCEKWRLIDSFGEKTNKYTLWIRYKVSENMNHTYFHRISASKIMPLKLISSIEITNHTWIERSHSSQV